MSESNASGSDTHHFQSEADCDGDTDSTEEVADTLVTMNLSSHEPIKLVKPVEATAEDRTSISRHAGPKPISVWGTHKDHHPREALSSKLSTPRQASDPSAAEPLWPYALKDKLFNVERQLSHERKEKTELEKSNVQLYEKLKQSLEELRVMQEELEETRQEAITKGENEQHLQQKCQKLEKECAEKEDTIKSLKESLNLTEDGDNVTLKSSFKAADDPRRLYSENGDIVTLRSSIEEDDGDLNIVKYNKRHRIGHSGANVYRGYKESSDVKVAVKKIIWDEITPAKAKKEAKLLEKAGEGCDYVVKYLFAIKDFDRLFIVMDLFETNLDDYIKGTPTSGTIPLRENLGTFEKQNVYRSILCQAIKGLAHLHSLLDFNNRDPKPIVHRDIKPQNILLRSDDAAPHKIRAVLTDFGLSKEAPGDGASLSADQRATMGYTAPEIVLKKEPISSKVDIFSMGCVMHFFLTEGEHPFGDAADERNYNIRKHHDPFMFIEEKGVDVISGAKQLILNMIKMEPTKRPGIEEVKRHCFFWDEKRRKEFFNQVNKLPPQTKSVIIKGNKLPQKTKTMISDDDEVFKGRWSDQILEQVWSDLDDWSRKESRPYDDKSIWDLIRAMRNMVEHIHAKPDILEAMKNKLGSCTGTPDIVVLRYFTSTFPNLLFYTWNIVRIHYSQHIYPPCLQEFYE